MPKRLIIHRLLLEHRQLPGRSDRISNLPSIQIIRRQFVKVVAEIVDIYRVAVVFPKAFQAGDEVLPDFLALVLVEGLVVEG